MNIREVVTNNLPLQNLLENIKTPHNEKEMFFKVVPFALRCVVGTGDRSEGMYPQIFKSDGAMVAKDFKQKQSPVSLKLICAVQFPPFE